MWNVMGIAELAMPRRRKNALDLAVGFGMAGLHTSMTLWHRFPVLAASCTPQGNAHHSGELTQIVSEKTSAVLEGAMEARRKILRLSFKAMTGRLDYKDMTDAMSAIAVAGMQPAFGTVRERTRARNKDRGVKGIHFGLCASD